MVHESMAFPIEITFSFFKGTFPIQPSTTSGGIKVQASLCV